MGSLNRVFFGCNYNDKKIKAQFDALKADLEDALPIECVVIDKRASRAARDIWQDIKDEIDGCGVAFFDVTAFRPNVVLELGYALALKEESDIYVTFRRRKSKGKLPTWTLSDISHLNRFEYTTVAKLDEFVEEQLWQTEWMQRVDAFYTACSEETNASLKYQSEGLKVLQAIRDEGPRTEQQIKTLARGSAVRVDRLITLLKRHKLVKRTVGRYSRYVLRDE